MSVRKRFLITAAILAGLAFLGGSGCKKDGAKPEVNQPADATERQVTALKSGTAAERKAAAVALGEMGATAKAAIPELTNALTDSDNDVRAAAVAALSKIDPECAPARSSAVRESLHKLASAMHKYHDDMGVLPPPTTVSDPGIVVNGQPVKGPGVSWRVLVLPYIGQEDLFKQFDLRQPWDSEKNKKLIEKMPKIYAPPAGSPARTKPGETHFQVFTASDPFAFSPTIFPHPFAVVYQNATSMPLARIVDGTSNTFLIVEVAKPVIWTKPEDPPFGAGPLPELGHSVEDIFHVAFADGSTRYCGRKTPARMLRWFIMPSDGNLMDHEALDPAKGLLKPEKEVAAVSGRVMFKGQPLANVWIIFVTKEGSEYSGLADAAGRYAIAKVPIGQAKVLIFALDPLAGWDGGKLPKKPMRLPLPPEYQREEQTPLRFQVKSGENEFDIQLN
jgi:hypothetical protein